MIEIQIKTLKTHRSLEWINILFLVKQWHSFLAPFRKGGTASKSEIKGGTGGTRPFSVPHGCGKGGTTKGGTGTESETKGGTSRVSRPSRAGQGNYEQWHVTYRFAAIYHRFRPHHLLNPHGILSRKKNANDIV